MWKLINILVLSLFGLIGVCEGQIIQNGRCEDNNIVLQSNFNIDQMVGTWYEYARTDHPRGGDCSTIEFARTGDAVTVYHKTVRQNFLEDYYGTASVPAETAMMTLNMPTVSSNPIDFWVWFLDQNTCALIYNCANVGTTQRQIYLWQLCKQPTATEMITALMNTTMVNVLGINSNDLREIDHGDKACYQLPAITSGQPVILPGQCDENIPVVQNFSAGDFLGVWHEISSYYSENALGSCNRAQYSSQDGIVVDVVNSQIINQTLLTIEGYAVVASNDSSARLTVVLEVLPNVTAESELLIIATDYTQWAVSYTCNNLANNQKRVFSWIVSRTRTLPDAAKTQVDAVVNSITDLNFAYYQPADQSNDGCFYIPDVVGDEPAVFGGQCDQTISVQPDFVAANYLGLWHDIESFPTPFQFGTCANAYYDLGEVGVDVFNTQVVNETLKVINGIAIPVGNEAKLVVSFPELGTNSTTDYWIISTDYNNYALVYSCTNINDYQQQITMWKLSRTKSLSTASNIAINNALANQAVFDERFFRPMDQSREGCFYYPEPVEGKPVVFPGKCSDEEVSVVSDFDLDLFSGQWFEVQAYPKDFQPGGCVEHQFSVASNTSLNLVSSSVANQLLGKSNSQLTFINGTDAKFILTISNGTNPISFPYSIIATDYVDYALAYSCVDIDEDFKRIYSWKLSRSKQLSSNAATAISNAIADYTVLAEKYFETVDQTDNGCFYFPELAPGEPVIFPGQCDPNITVVQDFNAARYLGRWRTIETYATEFQLGECGDATYSLNDNGTVDVFNTEVIDQTLSTINGLAVVASDDGSGKLLVTFPTAPFPSEYWILATDYDSFALVYSCYNINEYQRRVYSWKLSRTNSLTQQAEVAINAAISQVNVLDSQYYQAVNRSDESCFYFPEPDGRPVVFRGQCDENIDVVMGFDAARYAGIWYDIASYPAPFQGGTCGTANYDLDLSTLVVAVENTQVVNPGGLGPVLDVQTGTAVLALNDTSAKLLVTFDVDGVGIVTTDYWVLATDYDNFALVYSCQNLNDGETRQVNMWKISRTKSLSTTANNIIDNTLANQAVFDNRYFQPVDQSPEACFYYPEPVEGKPVVFPGQCDDEEVTVVSDFNLDLFSGQWFEVQAYPKDFQPGGCVEHQFSVANNTGFDLVSSSVADQLQGISTSQLTFINGTDARFTLTISNGSNPISFPYNIIATDYVDYALAYSCVDISDYFKIIYSWKLSRSKQLSDNATAAISNAMANTTVLAEEYFETVDQTDNGCFYFPELAPGEPVIFPGQCDPNITVVQDFNATRYLGRWRTIETYATEFQLGECGDATYSLNDNGTVDVFNTEVIDQTLSTINGLAVVASDDGSGKLLVTFPTAPVPSEYWILATDYDSYALVYSCYNINDYQRRVYSWKLSRTNSLTQQAEVAINAAISQVNVLDSQYYQAVNRSDESCFYFPEPDGRPVVFRGQCDENIDVVMGFDAARYAGIWYDIASYPAPFQGGTCGTANYDLDLSTLVVAVENTQVVNPGGLGPVLDVQTGTAVLALNDTSAKLLVTFDVDGVGIVTTDYWVLATDYDNFALVYSCQNLNDSETRQVNMWKISRTKSLSTTANNIIDNTLANQAVFDNRYFQPVDQSPEACFYYPEPVEGKPVVFPGQCDDEEVTVVSDFNLDLFSGQWFEVQAYPKDFQPGGCVEHQFSVANNTGFDLVSSSVADQLQGISTSQLTFINGTDARFTLTISNGSNPISFPYNIIATDYVDYALAYSCVDISDYFKIIYSWKLSRSKQLSDNATTAISNAMANTTVLAEEYFETVDQTDNGCFYFPELAPGEPVIFPGQCDPNITVVQDFNATRYLGRWRTIETYATEFQLGECGDATYSLNDNGTVDVFNTEVIDQTLSTINGLAVVASDDGSGKLLVTFPTAPVPSEYWILATDYDSYALVYSCYNINDYQRRVYSWKLSRTNSLTQQAEVAINAAIGQVNVLDSQYYQAVNRSDESCFYFPEPDGRPVVFRGQCDENIDVVMGFDAARYAGVWYSIESYPAPFQGGTCGTANYDLDLNTLVVAVENTQVVNPDGFGPVQDVQTGTAVLALNDTSAKLLVTFEVNGIIITTDYWVLATDYDNFALVYSCQNIEDESRQVNSWKLSRTRNLTTAASSAIATAINRVQVLEDRYFEVEGQSEEDCFFYPDNVGGDVILNGRCVPDNQVAAVTDFNANLFAGTWHEVARFPSGLQEGECTAAEYSIGAQNSITITQTEVNDEFQSSNIINGVLSSDGRGVINVEISGIPFNTFYILDTDYSEFALVYGCREIGNDTKQVYSWKFARSRSGLSVAANTRIDEVVKTNVDLFENYYTYTNQSNDACFHYPDFTEPPSTIVLPGLCDESIRGVADFRASDYLGRWIEIERYPQTDQFGTCDRAYYSLGDDNVLVRNTQVVGETLAEQLGYAEVASSDGTGLLNVTFVVNGITVHANYYLLATDYINYALVYSCRNLANDTRQVSSWKLSRTTSLRPEYMEIMNSVISQTQGLNQKYYQVTNQTDEACFYVPEVNVNEAPVFRGQCDENVGGVPNFDAARYAGWWHEIERYPVDNYRGECISSQYQTSGNSYLVTDTVVANGSATVSSGTVQVSADGRLRRTINGQVQDIWVLATDYETYSLLYSCESADNNNEYRRVWSAKHSKSRQLTTAAQAEMSPVITSNRLLYPQFYQEVDQSDAACFHYPAVTGQRVILPGQCDDNIPVVQNFDVEAYEGTWYQIERYPQTHEDPTSTCIGARYTLEASGTVTVLNWEVINGELMTIEGKANVTSNDGSAKLSVVLPVRGSQTNETVTTPLYVLRTDYENYSLAYSCTNINSFQRSIGAWKLSRKRTMSSEHHAIINDYMAYREELHQPYFVSVEHNEECEEPSSGALVRSSIVVMLICALWQILS